MIGALLAAFLAVNAQAQIVIDRFGGLDDTDAPAALQPFEAQDALNVESNLTGTAASKRKGFTQESSLTVSTAAVTGSHNFKDSSGNSITLVFHDRYGSKSTNGGAFVNWLTTAPANITRWQCVDVGGKAYCVNDQRIAPLEYDGTTQRPPATMPQGAVIELCNDRLTIADIAATPNRVAFSQSGVFTNFTTGTGTADPWTIDFGAPGDRVTALKCDRGRLDIFKTQSITSCILGDQYTTKCFPVSNAVGTLDPLTIVSAPDGIYFRSQDRAYWRLSDDGLTLVSQKIGNFVKSQTSGSQQSNTQTTQSDWQAGTQSPSGTWDTTTAAGSIFPSSHTVIPFVYVSSVNWQMSDVDTTTFVSTYVDNFDDGNYAAAPGFPWVVEIGTWTVSSNSELENRATTGKTTLIRWNSTASTGTWAVQFRSTGSATDYFNYYFVAQSTTPDIATRQEQSLSLQVFGNGSAYILKTIGGASGSCGGAIAGTWFDGLTHTFLITRSTEGWITLTADGNTATRKHISKQDDLNCLSNSVFLTSSTFNMIALGEANLASLGSVPNSDRFHIKAVWSPEFYTHQVSTSYAITYTTPTWGPYTAAIASATISSVTFSYQTSADASTWGTFSTLTAPFIPSSAIGQNYLRHRILMSAPMLNTTTSAVTSASLIDATTGLYQTQCINTGPSVSSWALLSCDTTITGNASLVFYSTTAYGCSNISTQTIVNWPQQSNNTALTNSVSVSSAVIIGWRSLLTSSTEQAQVNACTLYWNVGTAAQPSWGVYDPIKNSVYWSASINNASYNNRVLKYDLNLDQWYPFDLTATALRFVNSSVYFGSSSSATWNKYGSVDSDNGGSINAYWKSKDFSTASPFQETDWNAISLVSRNQVTGSMTGTWALSNGYSNSYTISLSTAAGRTYARSSYSIPKSSPANFINFKFGNNSSTPFEVLGLRFDGVPVPWRPGGP